MGTTDAIVRPMRDLYQPPSDNDADVIHTMPVMSAWAKSKAMRRERDRPQQKGAFALGELVPYLSRPA